MTSTETRVPGVYIKLKGREFALLREATPMDDIRWERHFKLQKAVAMVNEPPFQEHVLYTFYQTYPFAGEEMDFETWVDQIEDIEQVEPEGDPQESAPIAGN